MLKRFRDYMEEKVREYYLSSEEKFSALGDFFTSPELDRVFGESMAEFLYPYLMEFDSPSIVELGAGRGLLARDILSHFRKKYKPLFQKLSYHIWDISPSLIDKQKRVLQEFDNVLWVEHLPSVEGVFISNEFFDTLPVHVVKDGRELYVDVDGREVWVRRSDAQIREFLERMGYKDNGSRIEVCLDCINMLMEISKSLIRGYNLVIDYGYTSEEIDRFSAGSVVGYKRHRASSDIYTEEVIDLSAHVNFSALMEYGKDCGFETVMFESQRNFLCSIDHFVEELNALSCKTDPNSIERLSRLKTMLVSMGDRFKVLFQKKAIIK